MYTDKHVLGVSHGAGGNCKRHHGYAKPVNISMGNFNLLQSCKGGMLITILMTNDQ